MTYPQIEIDKLVPNADNPRRISQRELEKLKKSIKELGFSEPVIVNMYAGREYTIVGGHQRTLAAKALGMTTVPVFYVNLKKDDEEKLNIALNKISGEFDEGKLADMLQRLMQAEGDISVTGFDEPDIDKLMRTKEKLAEKARMLDQAPALKPTAKAKVGDVWILGDHRLMCGDATNKDDIDKLCPDNEIQVCVIDPPYGVSYGEALPEDQKKWNAIANDELQGDQLQNFLEAIYSNIFMKTKSESALYTFYASINHIPFERALIRSSYRVKQQLLWTKNMALGRSDYHWAHEPILYACKQGTNSEFFGDRTNKTLVLTQSMEDIEKRTKEELVSIIQAIKECSDILAYKKDPSNTYQHPTQKPVELLVRLIKNSSRAKDQVIDTCGGSGSTLMACEVSGRKARLMELDPRYVDVILERWAKYTEQQPIRERDKALWKDVQSQ